MGESVKASIIPRKEVFTMKRLGIAALLILAVSGSQAFASEFTDKYESALEANDMILQQQPLKRTRRSSPTR